MGGRTTTVEPLAEGSQGRYLGEQTYLAGSLFSSCMLVLLRKQIFARTGKSSSLSIWNSVAYRHTKQGLQKRNPTIHPLQKAQVRSEMLLCHQSPCQTSASCFFITSMEQGLARERNKRTQSRSRHLWVFLPATTMGNWATSLYRRPGPQFLVANLYQSPVCQALNLDLKGIPKSRQPPEEPRIKCQH